MKSSTSENKVPGALGTCLQYADMTSVTLREAICHLDVNLHHPDVSNF